MSELRLPHPNWRGERRWRFQWSTAAIAALSIVTLGIGHDLAVGVALDAASLNNALAYGAAFFLLGGLADPVASRLHAALARLR